MLVTNIRHNKMTLVLRKYLIQKNVLSTAALQSTSNLSHLFHRKFADDKGNDSPEFLSSTILVENGFNVQELPVVVRKWKDIDMEEADLQVASKGKGESISYQLIQAEFKQCVDLRDVFSLLSKCTKITPNIALGAMERIHYLENNPSVLTDKESKNMHINLAKGAILDKLIKVVIKTEDTQTILNVLQSTSTFMEPYKSKFSDELLFRTLDNKLSIDQICIFLTFLIENKSVLKYSTTIDKLWIGFIQRESDINEENIGKLFSVLPGLKVSKRILLTLLEQKLTQLWDKIKVPVMQDILSGFIEEKYSSMQTFDVVGTWLHMNIHAVDEDSLLDIITKITRLNYTDNQIQKAVEKYMKLKGHKIESYVLVVGILNYCIQFQIQSEQILNAAADYFLMHSNDLPPSFLKSFIFPFGFLSYKTNKEQFWEIAEDTVYDKFNKINADNLCAIVMSFLYVGKYPLKLVNRLCSPEYLAKINTETFQKLHLIDTALSLECPEYSGPLLPKDHWYQPINQDSRIKNIIGKTMETLIDVAGDASKVSTAVLVPRFCADETYLIDVMIHPTGLGSTTNWKLKSAKNENIAILIHLPDHYCSDNEQLVGPQVLRKKHLKILGMQVVSLKYSKLSQFYTSYNSNALKQYLTDRVNNAEPCV